MRMKRLCWGLAATSMFMTMFQQVEAAAAAPESAVSGPQMSYADFADLADSAELVLKVRIRKLVRVDDERASGLRPGTGRFYVRAETLSLLLGESAIGESVAYLADIPLDGRGKPPLLKKQEVLLFARPVPGRPAELQLVARDAQISNDPMIEATVRSILTEMVSSDAPSRITGVNEVIHVPGNLAGQGETQIFLATEDRSAASITVQHYASGRAAWGVSFSELLANVGHPPREGTLAWYRLACFLPNSLPVGANVSETASSRRQAEADYRMILGELGACRRTRR